MKKIISLITSLIMSLGALFVFTGCQDSKTDQPKNEYEKVKLAFNGVESSLKNQRNSNYIGTDYTLSALNFNNKVNRFNANPINDADISIIYNAMTVEEETSNPEFEYDEPPMIQFQYLKALYEEVGENFSFNTKYTHNLTGSIYYDFSTRTSIESDEYLQHYSFDLSLVIDIDDNDIITAIVEMDLTYTHNGENRNQKKYAELTLDYDMDETTPTYTLTMIDIDDLLSYENEREKYISAEYDYVNVSKNVINEWRKFGVCSNMALSNYQNDDFTYKYSVLRAFKNNKKYHITNEFNPDLTLKSSVITGLGFNDALVSRNAFISKEGVENAKIETVVNKFNNIFGGDIVNSFVYTGATEKWVDDGHQEYQNLFLREESTGGYQINKDMKLIDLFNPSVGWEEKGVKQFISILYKNGEEVTLAKYNDFNNLNVKVRSCSYNKTTWVDVEGKEEWLISDFIKESGFVGYYTNTSDQYSFNLEFDISLKSDPNVKLQSNFTIDIFDSETYKHLLHDWQLVTKYTNAYALIKDQIPDFIGNETTYYSPNINDEGSYCNIKLSDVNSLTNNLKSYRDTLINLGFTCGEYSSDYKKRINEDYILIITVYDDEIRVEFKNEKADKTTTLECEISLVGDFNGWDQSNTTYKLTPGDLGSNKTYLYEITIKIQAGQAFKIVKNYTWDDGGYGTDFMDSSVDKSIYTEGDHHNIIINNDGSYKIGVIVDSTFRVISITITNYNYD